MPTLGIDLGGTFARAAVGDGGGRLVASGRSHDGRAEAGAHQADGVGPRPDLAGDARGHAGLREGREHPVVETGIVRPRKHHEGRVGQVA